MAVKKISLKAFTNFDFNSLLNFKTNLEEFCYLSSRFCANVHPFVDKEC